MLYEKFSLHGNNESDSWVWGAYGDPFQKEQINVLDGVEKKLPKFANLTNNSNQETLVQRRKIAHICALYKGYSTEPTWETIGDRLQRPYYLSQVDHDWKITNRR